MISDVGVQIFWGIACGGKEFNQKALENIRNKQVTRDEKSPTNIHQTKENNKNNNKKIVDP